MAVVKEAVAPIQPEKDTHLAAVGSGQAAVIEANMALAAAVAAAVAEAEVACCWEEAVTWKVAVALTVAAVKDAVAPSQADTATHVAAVGLD